VEKITRATDPILKAMATRLIMRNANVKNMVGSDGGISLRIRNNVIMEAELKKRISLVNFASDKLNIDKIREKTLFFTEKMRLKANPYGQYQYAPSSRFPLLYASVYASLIRHLYDDLSQLSFSEKREWINYIQRHQHEDGLFKDPAVANELAETADWWGWRHLTLHTVMALTALNALAPKRLSFLAKFKDNEYVARWLNTRDWNGNVAKVSNEIQNHCALIQYARDYQNESWAVDAMDTFYDELDKLQNTETGSWGNNIGSSALLAISVQAGYHIWLLYFYDKKNIRFAQKIIDCSLSTQNRMGGFGAFLSSSACEDIDSLDPLIRLSHMTSHRKPEIEIACERALPWILTNMNHDGGFVFRRNEPYMYGHENMFSGINESIMFPTWFRTLSLAYLSKILPESIVGRFKWKFIDCPGYQFWRI
jgi:hypothetical protein